MAVQIVILIVAVGFRLKWLKRLYRRVLKDLYRIDRTGEVI
jgi:hypothetical protein|tara:strand:- start:256 stop:378 length:123 start_codon:yes stop_codon:yes gene_type:complete